MTDYIPQQAGDGGIQIGKARDVTINQYTDRPATYGNYHDHSWINIGVSVSVNDRYRYLPDGGILCQPERGEPFLLEYQ